MTVETSLLVDSTIGASPVTVTDSWRVESANWKSRENSCPICSVMSFTATV